MHGNNLLTEIFITSIVLKTDCSVISYCSVIHIRGGLSYAVDLTKFSGIVLSDLLKSPCFPRPGDLIVIVSSVKLINMNIYTSDSRRLDESIESVSHWSEKCFQSFSEIAKRQNKGLRFLNSTLFAPCCGAIITH
jgi:hypothetical protein